MPSSGGFVNSKKAFSCNVTFLDDAVATYDVPKDSKGSVLFQSVVRSLELTNESKYFGLLYLDNQSYPLWLDHDKKIKSQMKSDPPYKFQFRVKYYVAEPGVMLLEEITRYQFVLQIKKDIYQQRLSCTFRTLALLASYVIQSELGDFDPMIHKARYLREFKFIPNQPADLEKEIAELHALHSGLTPEEVEIKYLDKAKWLTGYGVDARSVRDVHGVALKLGISPPGIQVLQGSNVREVFDWHYITKLRFHQKKFYVKVAPKQPGGSEQEHCFLLDKTKHCKLLWKVCLEHHGFYKSLPPPDRGGTLPRSVSQKVAKSETPTRSTPYNSEMAPRDQSRDRTPRARDMTHVDGMARNGSQPNTPHRTSRPRDRSEQRDTTRDRMDLTRDMSRDRSLAHQQHRSRERLAPDYSRGARNEVPNRYQTDYEQRRNIDYERRGNNSHSLPRTRPDNTRPDNGYYDNWSENVPLAKRSQSFGAKDILDLDYIQQYSNRDYNNGNYGNYLGNYNGNYNGNYGAEYKSTGALPRHNQGYNEGKVYRDEGIKSYFTDNILQSNPRNHDNSHWRGSSHVPHQAANQRPRNGTKSTPDVRIAASQPAFITSSAARQANFLMTTEL